MSRRLRFAARAAVPASVSMVALAAAIGVLHPAGAAAQSSPNSFQLPEPSPTPTPAPQGPVDVREGVPIGPRSIPTEEPVARPTSRPTASPTARPTATPSPAPALRTPAPDASSPDAASTTQSGQPGRTQTAPSAPSGGGAAASSDADQSGLPPAAGVPDTAAPIESDQVPDSSASVDGPGGESPGADGTAPATIATDGDPAGQSASYWPWLAGLLAILAAGIAAWFWRRRAGNRVTKLAAPTKPKPLPTSGAGYAEDEEPPRVDLSLDIVVATRSLMQFSFEYRVTLANRSERAVRDLNISAQLASARRGAPNAPPLTGAHPLETIERIGPHQSRAVTGQMAIPLAEVGAILQGQKPLFIPLLHLTIESAGQPAVTRTFVVGSPSAASEGRLHPIPLDTPPGSVPGLKAREITVKAA